MSNASKQLYRTRCANDMHKVLPGSKRSKVEVLERNCVHYFKTCQDVKPFAPQAVSCAGGVGIQYCQCKSNFFFPRCFAATTLTVTCSLHCVHLYLSFYCHLAQVAFTLLDNSGVKSLFHQVLEVMSVWEGQTRFLPQDQRKRSKWVYILTPARLLTQTHKCGPTLFCAAARHISQRANMNTTTMGTVK